MSKDPQEVVLTPEELEQQMDSPVSRTANNVMEISGYCQNAEYGFPVIIGAVVVVGRPVD